MELSTPSTSRRTHTEQQGLDATPKPLGLTQALLQRKIQRRAIQRQSAAPQGPTSCPQSDEDAALEQQGQEVRQQTDSNQALRGQVDAINECSQEADQLRATLNAGRRALVPLLQQYIARLSQRIQAIRAEVGEPRCEPNLPPCAQDLWDQMARHERQRAQAQAQLTALQRWSDRQEINAINAQLAQNPGADQQQRLKDRKQQLATGLLATATEYKQYDPAWGNQRYGNQPGCTTVREAACGPTSLAMLLDFQDQEDPEGQAAQGRPRAITPNQTVPYAADHGRVCNNGTAGDPMINGVGGQWPQQEGQKLQGLSQVIAALRNGVPVMFLCKDCGGQTRSGGLSKYGGHYMVLKGVDGAGQTFQVLDSGRNEQADIETISRAELEQHSSGFWVVQRRE